MYRKRAGVTFKTFGEFRIVFPVLWLQVIESDNRPSIIVVNSLMLYGN